MKCRWCDGKTKLNSEIHITFCGKKSKGFCDPYWICTRELGHDGPHVACFCTNEDPSEHGLFLWMDDNLFKAEGI